MPYESNAQRKKFHVLEAQGKISHKVVQEFDNASRGMHLPEHATPSHRRKAKVIHDAVMGKSSCKKC